MTNISALIRFQPYTEYYTRNLWFCKRNCFIQKKNLSAIKKECNNGKYLPLLHPNPFRYSSSQRIDVTPRG
ncbi:hypothetical protein D3C75_659350 [compost metagenome]